MLINKINRDYIIPGIDTKIPSVTEIVYGENKIFHSKHILEALARGTAVHKQLESLVTPKYLQNRSINKINKVAFSEATVGIMKQLQHVLFNELKISDISKFTLMNEKSFYNENNGMPYVGTVDLVVKDSLGNTYVFDYKTGKTQSHNYHIQIAGYAKYFNAKRGFLIFENSFIDVDLQTNTDRWNRCVEDYYNKIKINKDNEDSLSVEDSVKIDNAMEDRTYIENNDISINLLRTLHKLKINKETQDSLRKEESELKEIVAKDIGNNNLKFEDFHVYHKKGGVSRGFTKDFQEWLFLQYEDKLVKKESKSSLVFSIKKEEEA